MSDLSELFARDPLSYTKDGKELETIIAEMRKKRGQFVLGNAKAGNMKAPTSEKAKAVAGIDLGGLDL